MGIRIVQIFTMNTANLRIVLGDWRTDAAQILEINPQQNNMELKLKKWSY